MLATLPVVHDAGRSCCAHTAATTMLIIIITIIIVFVVVVVLLLRVWDLLFFGGCWNRSRAVLFCFQPRPNAITTLPEPRFGPPPFLTKL